MDREVWWATVYGVTKSQKQLTNTHTHKCFTGLKLEMATEVHTD